MKERTSTDRTKPAETRTDAAQSPSRGRPGLIAFGVIAVLVLMAVGGSILMREDGEELPEVTFSGALRAIKEDRVARVHMVDSNRQAILVLRDGAEAVTVYPERSGPELVTAARHSNVELTAAPRTGGRDLWWILYALVPASVVTFMFLMWVFAVMDRRGIWHEKDTWVPGPRVKRLQESVDRVEAALDRIEHRLGDGRDI